MLKAQGKTVVLGDARLENRESLFAEVDRVQPTHILNAAGVTGRPNIDWCETHQVETLRTNVIGTLNCAEAAHSTVRGVRGVAAPCHACTTRRWSVQWLLTAIAHAFYQTILGRAHDALRDGLHLRVRRGAPHGRARLHGGGQGQL